MSETLNESSEKHNMKSTEATTAPHNSTGYIYRDFILLRRFSARSQDGFQPYTVALGQTPDPALDRSFQLRENYRPGLFRLHFDALHFREKSRNQSIKKITKMIL
jgi:hypothetical protein